MNLETWRQFWRVLGIKNITFTSSPLNHYHFGLICLNFFETEMSDILLCVVDIRFPVRNISL